MARIINDQINTWGREKGVDAQRSDLWVIDFNHVLANLDSTLTDTGAMSTGVTAPYVPMKLSTYYAASVSMPELKVRAEPVRRDSRPYQMPSWDDPLDAIRVVFWLDCYKTGGSAVNPFQSDLYQMLEAWRAVVRAGRGQMSSEYAITLNENYSMNYAFDVRVNFLRGSSNPQVTPASTATSFRTASEAVSNDLEYSLRFRLVNCWLSSFKTTELTYESAKLLQIESIFYAEDILQVKSGN